MNLSIDTGIPALAVFLQGLFSFFSPCVLPLVPLYIGYLAGGTGVPDENGILRYPRKKVLLNTLFFMLGVSFAFFLLGFGFTAAGQFFSGNRVLFARVGGVLVILFGVYQLGFLGSSQLLSSEHRLPFRLQSVAMNPLVALVMGFTFSFAWTPCVGPALTTVLLMASSAGSAAQGYLLIGVYTLGFLLPFLAVGLFTGQLLALFRRHQRILGYTVKAGGVLMILLGIMMLTGWMNGFTGYLSQFGAPTLPSASQGEPTPAPTPESNPYPAGSVPDTPPREMKETVFAPDFTLTDQYGNSHTLSEYKGKVVFLNFWATWCRYCKEEMPDIQKLYEKYSGDDSEVVILGVASPKNDENPNAQDVSQEDIEKFLEKGGYTYPNVMDLTGGAFSDYNVSGLPTTYMIDREGNIFGYVPGGMTAEMMQSIIDQTLQSGGSEATTAASEPPLAQSGNPYIRGLSAAAAKQLELPDRAPFQRVQAAYEYLIATTRMAPPLGLDSWRIEEGGDVVPDYIENRALSPLAYGTGSCEDYACAMVLLLRQMGFSARYVPGITVSVQGPYVDHAWAMVEIGGDWYHLDPQLEDNVMKNGVLGYRYFLKTDQEMLADHRWGQNLLDYTELSPAQREEVERSWLMPASSRVYPAVTPRPLASSPPRDAAAITAQLAAARALYEADHGSLPPLTLNIVPPVFGKEGYGPEE